MYIQFIIIITKCIIIVTSRVGGASIRSGLTSPPRSRYQDVKDSKQSMGVGEYCGLMLCCCLNQHDHLNPWNPYSTTTSITGLKQHQRWEQRTDTRDLASSLSGDVPHDKIPIIAHTSDQQPLDRMNAFAKGHEPYSSG